MAYPVILKRLSQHIPVLRRIINERDTLRVERAQLASKLLELTDERDHLQALLQNLSKGNTHSGYCHCCRQNTFFQITGTWLRDEYLCLHCRSIPRQRHLQHILDTRFVGWENLTIHESSPSNDFVARWCQQYSASQYFDGVKSGEWVNGVHCENLECLSFNDNSIDIFITQDVFEHVFHPELAVREIHRVLKPGGAHVFTVPKLSTAERSEPRARLSAGGIDYLKEASYHGNPVGDGKALVTWDYGADFERLIDAWSGLSTSTYAEVNRAIGVDGEFREVFVSRKPL
ncbi:MAG: class I SAM-dependent methyltransferase [Pseudomonadales bacterium]|jgi:SAM-dependent methyltransferase|nr:class I SAM-dependent methyltransferase [Pseudomonadales bacterium]